MKLAPLFAILFTLSSHLALAGDKEIAYVKTDLDKDGKADSVVIYDSSTEQDQEKLSLIVMYGNGVTLRNDKIIQKCGLGDEPGVTLKLLANGSVLVRSVKDWGTSMWSSDLYLSQRDAKLVLSGFDHEWMYRERGGKCEFNFLTGQALINKKKKIDMGKEEIAFGPDASVGGYLDYCLEHTDSK